MDVVISVAAIAGGGRLALSSGIFGEWASPSHIYTAASSFFLGQPQVFPSRRFARLRFFVLDTGASSLLCSQASGSPCLIHALGRPAMMNGMRIIALVG